MREKTWFSAGLRLICRVPESEAPLSERQVILLLARSYSAAKEKAIVLGRAIEEERVSELGPAWFLAEVESLDRLPATESSDHALDGLEVASEWRRGDPRDRWLTDKEPDLDAADPLQTLAHDIPDHLAEGIGVAR